MIFSSVVCAENINIYTWEDYFSDDVIAEFEQKTGHKVTLTYYDSETDRDALLLSEKAKNFNIVLIDSLMLGINSKKQPMYRFSEKSVPTIVKLNPPQIKPLPTTGYFLDKLKASWMQTDKELGELSMKPSK